MSESKASSLYQFCVRILWFQVHFISIHHIDSDIIGFVHVIFFRTTFLYHIGVITISHSTISLILFFQLIVSIIVSPTKHRWSSRFTGASFWSQPLFFSRLYVCNSFIVCIQLLNTKICWFFKSSFILLIPANTELFHLTGEIPLSVNSSATLHG